MAVSDLSFNRQTRMGEYLRDVIIRIPPNYNVTIDHVYSCTTDNDRNMLKCNSLIYELLDDTTEDSNDAPLYEFDETSVLNKNVMVSTRIIKKTKF